MSDAKLNSTKPPLPRRRPWRGIAMLLVVMLLVGVWFAPEIVARTALRHRAADWLLTGLPLHAEVGSVSLSWRDIVAARDVMLRDNNGDEVATVAELRTDRTLWQLVSDRPSLGTLTLRDPTANVRLRDGGSNVEELIAAWNTLPSSEPVPSLRVELQNARIEFSHLDTKRTSSLNSLDVKFASSAAGLDFASAEIPSKVASDSAADTGRLAAYFGKPVVAGDIDSSFYHNSAGAHADAVAVQPSDNSPQLLVRAKDWRLDWLNTVLARWQSTGEVAGVLSADCRLLLGESLRGTGVVAVQDLNVAGLSGMGTDRLRFSEISLRGNVATHADRLVIDEAELKTEVGSLTATGNVPVSGWSFKTLDEALRKLSRETFRVDGEVDLAKLAALLPQTLAVREGTRIDGGSISLALASEPQNGHEKLHGKVEVARLSAVADGRRFDWDVPLQVLIATRRDGDEFVFDRVACHSDFLQADAKGTLTDATFQLKGDLDRLHQNLSRFFDWGILRMSGQVAANGQIQRRDGGEVELRTKTELTNFELQRRGESPWREERLEIVASSTARLTEQRQLRSIESATLRLVSGKDQLDVKLSEPLDWSPNARWQAVADVVGGLDSWQARLRPVLVIEDWQVAGQVAAHAELRADSRVIDVAKLSVAIDNLQARGPEWLIQEPKLTLESAGRWETATSRWSAPQMTLIGTSAAATISDLNWSLDGANAGASGDARFRVHLGNVSRWKVQAQQKPNYFVAGETTGSLRLNQRGSTTSVTLDSRVTKLAVATPKERTQSGWETVWQEPEVKFTAQATFDSSKQSLQLSDAKLSADGLEVDLAGQVADLEATPLIDISGDVTYNWDRLTQRLGESLRRNVQLTGQDRRKFALRGRLSSPEVASSPRPSLSNVSRTSSPSDAAISALTGEAGLGWRSANFYGLTAGAGDLSCKLSDGVGALSLRDIPVNEGTVRLSSQLRLDRSPALIVLQSDRVIDKVRLSPELCAGWLKFVAPIMADATRVEGRFSVVLANGTLPVSDPANGEVVGRFAVHQAQLSPGPFADQVITIVDRIKTLTKARSFKPNDLLSLVEPSGAPANSGRERVWVTLPEQDVPFHMSNGRVFHEGLTLVTKEATLITRGSVGLDESLDLIVEVPVRDEWIANSRELASLRGKSLSLPVRGSLTRPQVDARTLESLARETLSKPLENLLDDELQKGLNKFLPRPKK